MTTHELCRFRAGFAGLPKTKPAKFRGILNTPEKASKACSLMGFACLQVCFRSERVETLENSTQWNKTVVMWETCGKVYTYEYQNAPALLGVLQNSRPRVGALQNPLTSWKIRRVL